MVYDALILKNAMPCVDLEQFYDTKGVISSHKQMKDRQYNDQREKDRNTNNDLQNTAKKTKD